MSMNMPDLNALMMETISCLTVTFSSADKNERDEAERRLKELEGDLLTHLKLIMEVIKNGSLVSNEKKISVILYLKRIIKNKIQDKALSREYAIEILKNLIEVIISDSWSDNCLQNLTLCIQDLLNFKLVSENKQIVNDLVVLLANYLQTTMGKNISLYKNLTFLLENIILSSSVSHQNVNEILKIALPAIEYMLKSVLEHLQGLDIIGNITHLSLFLTYIDTCRMIFGMLYHTLIKMRSRLNILQNVIELFTSRFSHVSLQLITMSIPGSMMPVYVSFKGESEFDNPINSMKAKVFQFLNVLVGGTKQKVEDNDMIKIYSVLIQTTVENLDWILANKFDYIREMSKDSKNFPDYNHENLLYQMLLFLAKILVKSPFLENFSSFIKNFCKMVVIPLLVGSNKELLKMKEDGEEYSNELSDVIDDHKSKTVKSVTGLLMQNLCDKYDGLTSYLVNYSFQVMDFGIKGADANNIQQYPHLTVSDRLLVMASLEFQIETCILIFCILTSNIFKLDILKENLRNLIITHFQALISANSDIIRNRFSLFLGIYVDSIFQPEDEHFSVCLDYLFNNLFFYKLNQGVAHQAADSLNDITGVKKFSSSIKNVVNKNFLLLIQNINEINIRLYFDVMLEIVLNVDIDEFVVVLMKELTARVLKEIAPYTRIKFKVTNEDGSQTSSRREKNNQYNIVVNKCFNIIRSICDKPDYVMRHILTFEEILEPIFEHMKNPAKIDFDEDIVLIITSFIKNLKTIPSSALKVLSTLPKYLKKSKGLLLDLYELMNQYVIYGKGIVDVKEDYNKVIMKIFRASFDQKSDYDNSAFLGASLMQIWLENSPDIPEPLVREIILTSIEQIKKIVQCYKNVEDFEESSDLYTYVALLVVIFSGFINYPQITFESLITNNDVGNFIRWTEEMVSLKFHSVYMTKSIIIGMSAFLRNENLMKQIPDFINRFLNYLLVLLNKQKKEESENLKSALKKEIHCNFIDSDEEEEEDSDSEEGINSRLQNINKILSKDMEKIYKKFNIDEYNGFSNEKEIKDICSRTVNPIKSLDEYEFFKQSIEYLNKIDSTIWTNWTDSLSDKERITLKNLIHTRRVNITHNKVQAQVPRKLVKIVNRNSKQN